MSLCIHKALLSYVIQTFLTKIKLSERLQFCLPGSIAMGKTPKILHHFQMGDTIEVIVDVIFVRIL